MTNDDSLLATTGVSFAKAGEDSSRTGVEVCLDDA
jgi:hypothetical protein